MLERIREERERLGLTQEQLARLLFVTQQSVNNYEKGRNYPDVDVLIRFALITGCSIDYLVNLSDIRTPADKMSAEYLTPEEKNLLNVYRGLPPKVKISFYDFFIGLDISENGEKQRT